MTSWTSSVAILNNVATMDELLVPFHSPKTKKKSLQWVKKGQPDSKSHDTRSKQMELVFFDAKDVVSRSYIWISRGAKQSMPCTPRRIWLCPQWFSGRRGPSWCPRTGFYTGAWW
jgi:hypothetical protein